MGEWAQWGSETNGPNTQVAQVTRVGPVEEVVRVPVEQVKPEGRESPVVRENGFSCRVQAPKWR